MAYTATLCDTVTISTSGDTICGSQAGTTSYSGDGKTYYIAATFNAVGSAELRFYGTTLSGTAYVTAYASNPSATFDDSTGWPSPYIVNGTTTAISTSERALAVTVNITTSGTTVYFYFRNVQPNVAVLFPIIRFTESSTPLWSDKYTNLGYVTSNHTETLNSTDPYKIYCYRARFNTGGTLRFEQPSGGPSTYLFVTETYSSAIYDHTTGLISSSDCLDWAWGPNNIDISIGNGATLYFWIRHYNGSATSGLTFNLLPPGSVWATHGFDSSTQITTSGTSWSGSAGDILAKQVEYIPLTFSTAGSYTFSFSGSDGLYGYLTSSTAIDSNGNPTSVLASDTSGSSSVSFAYTVSTGTTYYLMFRTGNGSENSYSFSISVAYNGGSGGQWLLDPSDLGTQPSQYYTYHSYSQYTLYKRVVRFSTSGTVTFYSAASSSGTVVDPKGWITTHVSGNDYDDVNGTPPSTATILASNDDGAGNRQFTMTATVSANTQYDFWFRLCNASDSGYGWIYIDPPSGGGNQWSYSQLSSLTNLSAQTTKTVTLSSWTGGYFAVTFAYGGSATISIPSGANADLFVTSADNSYDPSDGCPYSDSGGSKATSSSTHTITVTTSGTYYVWAKGSTSSTQGNLTVTITPPSQSQLWTLTATADKNVSTADVFFSFSLTAGYMYVTKVTFSQAGTVRFYTTGGNIRLGWLTAYTGSADIDRTTGIPSGTILASDTSSEGDIDFSYSVQATTYYFYIRSSSYSDTTQLNIYFSPQQSSSYRVVKIYTSSGWKNAIVWVYTSSGWKIVTIPWIYTSSGWKKTVTP